MMPASRHHAPAEPVALGEVWWAAVGGSGEAGWFVSRGGRGADFLPSLKGCAKDTSDQSISCGVALALAAWDEPEPAGRLEGCG